MITRRKNCEQCILELCKKDNLKFLTKELNQKPTLYFALGKFICNIQQEHADGPKISLYTNNRFNIFFSGTKAKEKLMKETGNLLKLAKQDSHISMVPQNGWNVLIYSTTNKHPDGMVKNNRFFPAGSVELDDLQTITQHQIDQMIANISEQECDSESMIQHWVHRIDSLQKTVRRNDTADNNYPAVQNSAQPINSSTDALMEVLSYARQALIDVQNNYDQYYTDEHLTDIELLSSKNALLKKKLSELDHLLKEYL